MFLSGKAETRISFKYFINSFDDIGNIVTTGLPSLLRQALTAVSTIILNLMAGPYGDEAIAALSIVSRIAFFVFSVSLGIGQGFQPVSAFNYGAKKYSRVKKGFFVALTYSVLMMIVMAIGVYLNAEFLVSHFRDDEKVVEIGVRALKILVCAQVTMPFCMMMEMLLQTTGDKVASSFLSSCRSGLIYVPCIIVLAYCMAWKKLSLLQCYYLAFQHLCLQKSSFQNCQMIP